MAVPIEDGFAQSLAAASDQYLVSRGDEKTVIAGYHWFGDWGRDTMIALPGLTLPTGKYEVARSILRTFTKHVDQGMLPNRFPDAGETPEYNTVDAALWFFEAARAYLAYTSDQEFVRDELYPVFADIISWHVAERATESKWIPAACWLLANWVLNLRGWMPRSATGW